MIFLHSPKSGYFSDIFIERYSVELHYQPGKPGNLPGNILTIGYIHFESVRWIHDPPVFIYTNPFLHCLS